MDDYERIAFQLSNPVSINWTTSEFKNNVKTVMEHITWLLGEIEHAEARMGARWMNVPAEEFEESASQSKIRQESATI